MFILLCAFMFQGPAGAKGDKGERVSHSTHTIQPLFRANQVLFYSLMLHNPFFFFFDDETGLVSSTLPLF